MSKHKLLILAAALGCLVMGAWLYLRNRSSGQIVAGMTGDPASTLASVDGRTNVVFLGIAGQGHQAGDLTDSIMLFSYDHLSNQIALIPIPRDVWVDSLQAKINTAFHYGNEKREFGGRDLVKSAVAEVTGLSVQYAVVLDFSGFEKLIDAVGGIDVNVDRTFEDFKYPIPGLETVEPESDRYEHLRFVQGPAHMDGATALKYARSRHAQGEEGTDFARSQRQEKVVLAFKNKLLSSNTLLNPAKLENLLTSVQDSLISDIREAEIGAFIRLFLGYSKDNVTPKTIDISELFVTPKNLSPYKGQWVLVPKTKVEDIHAYVAGKLKGE